jgi:sialate O-acetylesterase
MKASSLLLLAGVAAAHCIGVARANVIPNPLFSDNAVLQQGIPVPVWGTANPGEKVTVQFDGQSVSTTAGADGKWLVRLAPLQLGKPRTLTISGNNTIVLHNILVGEVWLCGGQSNMERQLGLREGQKPIANWKQEVARANYPEIRHFGVEQNKSFSPVQSVKGSWAVCSPATVSNFTAVGYFFGRDLHQARHVPIGLIHSSWGGTPAEAWMSLSALADLPDFAGQLAQIKHIIADPAQAQRELESNQAAWYARVDLGSRTGSSWSAAQLDDNDWRTMTPRM